MVRKRSWPAVSCRHTKASVRRTSGHEDAAIRTQMLSLTFFPLTSILWT
jgi:hypothetical protein